MTATSINYTPPTYEEIFYTLILDQVSKGNLIDDGHLMDYVNGNKDTENVIILKLSAYARQLKAAYNDLDLNKSLNDPTLATGDDLVNMCYPFIGEKIPPNPATVTVTLTANPAPEADILIPLGTVIADEDDPTITFTTIQDVTLINGTTTIDAPTICDITGPRGNVAANTLTELLENIPGITSVTNTLAATGGADEETDTAYLTRFLSWRYSQKRGTMAGITEVIKSIPSIVGYHIEPYQPDGYGSTQITIDPPTQALIDELTDALETWKAVDENIVVVGVVEVPVSVDTTIDVSLDENIIYTVEEKSILENLITEAIVTYINGLGISRDFIPYLCGVYLSNTFSQIKNITFTTPASPVTVDANEAAVAGTISVTVN